jgi:hypothetical protein
MHRGTHSTGDFRARLKVPQETSTKCATHRRIYETSEARDYAVAREDMGCSDVVQCHRLWMGVTSVNTPK